MVTRHGEKVAVVLGFEEWQRLTRAKPSFADLILSFPGPDLEFVRDRRPARSPFEDDGDAA